MGNLYLQDNSQYIQKINNPFLILGIVVIYDMNIETRGGGLTGQTDAITLGIARALVNNPSILFADEAGLLTRSLIKQIGKYGETA